MSFFFCKQKTAYGMRISDWSSDVCSSYLGDGGECIDPACGLEPALHPHIGLVEPRPDEAVYGVARLVVRPFLVPVQSGRASCRERGCQYVSTTVVAGSLKKTHE